MNPSFMAMQKAGFEMLKLMLTGKEHEPKKDKETSINGRAFAPGKGVQQLESSEEKEAKVRAHLDKLAEEAKARYAANPYDALSPAESYEVPTKTAEVNALGMTRAELSDAVKMSKCPTIAEIAAERHRGHQAYIDRQILLNRTTYIDRGTEVTPIEPKYPTSDLIDALHEHIAETAARTKTEEKFEREQADENNAREEALNTLHRIHDTYIEQRIQTRREAVADAVIHTGEGMNIEDAQANNGVNWSQHPDERFEAK